MCKHDDSIPEKSLPADSDIEIDSFSKLLLRYSGARAHALSIVEYLETQIKIEPCLEVSRRIENAHSRITGCGNWLQFYEYCLNSEGNPDAPIQNSLVRAQLCGEYFLCPLCAIRRSTRYAQQILKFYQGMKTEGYTKAKESIPPNSNLKALLVTFTVKNGPDLKERFAHLKKAMESFRKAMNRKKSSSSRNTSSNFAAMTAAVFSYEFTYRHTGWHPHVHGFCVFDGTLPDFPYELDPRAKGSCPECQREFRKTKYKVEREKCSRCLVEWGRFEKAAEASGLSLEWRKFTGDSFIVDAQIMDAGASTDTGTSIDTERLQKGLLEALKYPFKFSELPFDKLFHAWQVLKGRQMLTKWGDFRNIQLPDSLLDPVPTSLDIPFVEHCFRFENGLYREVKNEDMPADFVHFLDREEFLKAGRKKRHKMEIEWIENLVPSWERSEQKKERAAFELIGGCKAKDCPDCGSILTSIFEAGKLWYYHCFDCGFEGIA